VIVPVRDPAFTSVFLRTRLPAAARKQFVSWDPKTPARPRRVGTKALGHWCDRSATHKRVRLEANPGEAVHAAHERPKTSKLPVRVLCFRVDAVLNCQRSLVTVEVEEAGCGAVQRCLARAYLEHLVERLEVRWRDHRPGQGVRRGERADIAGRLERHRERDALYRPSQINGCEALGCLPFPRLTWRSLAHAAARTPDLPRL
jgi:hypothetical protein